MDSAILHQKCAKLGQKLPIVLLADTLTLLTIVNYYYLQSKINKKCE